jgi:hypothetical protein
MSGDHRKPNVILNNGIRWMRDNIATDAQIEDAASRVLEHLHAENAKVVPHPAAQADSAHRITSCEQFRSLIPAYLSRSLTNSRTLLLEDHINECVSCRKSLEQVRGTAGQSPRPYTNARTFPVRLAGAWTAVIVAAAIVLIAFQTTAIRDFFWPVDVYAMVQTVEGGLYIASGQIVHPGVSGQRIERSQVVRTGNGSKAVLTLADGSRIEMNSRTELWLDRVRDGVRINVNRGNIIVNAAKQHGGHLYAATKEVGVAVVGTVFEVSAGVKGSRVAVIEGEVRVQQGSAVQSVRPGQQFSTDPAMGNASLQSEISWSNEYNRYLALLNAARDVAERSSAIEMRHTSDLVPLVPADTVVFASLPNISQPLAQSYQAFKQRLIENPILADWWQQKGNLTGLGPILDQTMDHLTHAGNYLGAEVVFAFPANSTLEAPVLLADTAAPDQLASALRDIQARVALSAADVRSLAGSKGAIFFVGDGLMIASADGNQILRTLQYRSQPGTNLFASTALYVRLEQAYTEGVGWLLAADLERLTGNTSMQQLLVEQKTGSGGAAYRATLAFKNQRSGMAAWLAEPSPMGGLEFISPGAYGLAGVVTKEPLLMFDDIAAMFQSNGQAWQDFLNYQAEHRVDIRQDLIATLGNELLIAIDGPILPTPGWRIVVEVNDAARLQNTIEWIVSDMNREASARQQTGVTLTSEMDGGHTLYRVSGLSFPTEVHYTYWAGYMIIGPSNAMVLEAIQNHDTGNSLMRSASFRSQLPSDGQDYVSGFVYQNAQALTGSAGVAPSLVALYGQPSQIVMSSKGMLGMNVANIAGMGGMLKFAGLK